MANRKSQNAERKKNIFASRVDNEFQQLVGR